MGKWEKKEKLRIAAHPTKTTNAVLGQTGMADQTAVAVTMEKSDHKAGNCRYEATERKHNSGVENLEKLLQILN